VGDMRMMILVLMLLSECGWLAPGRSQLHETAEAVFAEGSAFVHLTEAGEEVYFYCHVNEEPTCFFVPYDQIESYDGTYDAQLYQNLMPRDLAVKLIDMLGGIAFESMPNNGTKARCIRADGRITCERVRE